MKNYYKNQRFVIILIIMAIFTITGTILLKSLQSLHRESINYFTSSDIENILSSDTNKTGDGILIAYIDSGISTELSEQIGDRTVAPFNSLDLSSDVTDEYGHGTSVICIVACEYQKTGIYGIAPSSKVMPIKAFDEHGNTNIEAISLAIQYAIDHDVDIINMSFGVYQNNSEIKNQIIRAHQSGIIIVAASGDFDNNQVAFPANQEREVISVGNYDLYDGVKESIRRKVDFYVSATEYNSIGISNIKVKVNGSSFSSAIFTGITARLIDIYDSNNDEVFNMLYLDKKKDIKKIIMNNSD